MIRKTSIKLTANFERNLESIEAFLTEADARHAYDTLLDALLDTLIPNLERFPDMGRPFLEHAVRSVEVTNALAQLKVKLHNDALMEYLFRDYVVLYVKSNDVIHLLSIKHHRQLSFDFEHLWVGHTE
ncbi:type II toxin-antitoxin system RelE/ParE family toxin [Glaciimonas sp. GG7]